MPAPPPKGVSSTWPPDSGVCSRKSTHSIREPVASTFAMWRCSRSQSNHRGNRVKMSMSIGAGRLAVLVEPEERAVDLDPPLLRLDRTDRVGDHRHEQRLAATRTLHLEHLARGQLDQPRDGADGAPAVEHGAALE